MEEKVQAALQELDNEILMRKNKLVELKAARISSYDFSHKNHIATIEDSVEQAIAALEMAQGIIKKHLE